MEITKKKKMRKGGYVNSTTWTEANQESVQTGHKPQFMLQAATNTRGPSVEGKDGPQLGIGNPHFSFFRLASRSKAFQNSICCRDYCVGVKN